MVNNDKDQNPGSTSTSIEPDILNDDKTSEKSKYRRRKPKTGSENKCEPGVRSGRSVRSTIHVQLNFSSRK